MMVDSVSEEQRKRFFRQSYAAHLPGYTGHCPTLKFRVGKRFGACTQEIMKELLEKKILKTGPYRPNFERDTRENTINYDKDIDTDWKNETHFLKAPPYILGYTGYIPGFNSKYGLSFMRAVEEGAREWRKNQTKLKARSGFMQARVERNITTSGNLLFQPSVDNVTAVQIDQNHGHNHDKNQSTFYYEVSPERPPIVGYTGHIPGVKGEVALSKRYAQAAKKGLELVRKEREQRLSKIKDTDAIQRVLDVAHFDQVNLVRV